MRRPALIVLVVLNSVVLLGQVWPENAPPYARYVTLAFLVGSLVFFGRELMKRR